jgi:integrase
MLRTYKRGKYYHISGSVSFAGQSVRVRQSTGQTRKGAADDVCRLIEQRILNDMQGKVTLMPLSEAAGLWFNNKSMTDWYNIKTLVGHFKSTPISEINADAWNKFVRTSLGNCKPSHINRVRATLVAIANHVSAPLQIPKMKDANDRIRFLIKEQQEKLLDAYPEFIKPFFITICYQGFRRQEALNLKRQGVNFESNTIQLIVKGGKLLTVPMHPRVREALLPHIRQNNAELVFLNKAGKPYSFGDSLRGLHIRACRKAGISDFTIHDWRHHWASQLVMKGASIPSLMKLGGWASERMVLRYASVSDEHIRDTLMRLE